MLQLVRQTRDLGDLAPPPGLLVKDALTYSHDWQYNIFNSVHTECVLCNEHRLSTRTQIFMVRLNGYGNIAGKALVLIAFLISSPIVATCI